MLVAADKCNGQAGVPRAGCVSSACSGGQPEGSGVVVELRVDSSRRLDVEPGESQANGIVRQGGDAAPAAALDPDGRAGTAVEQESRDALSPSRGAEAHRIAQLDAQLWYD